MTLSRLLWSSRLHLNKDTFKDLLASYREIKKNFAPFRKWRNKWYLHLDYELTLNGDPDLDMPLIPGKDLIRMVDLINEFMSILATGTTNPVDFGGETFHGDGRQIIKLMKRV
ncbi:MAG: hypothetical protein DWG76_06690 [Chloroflexi bacterium]|nr:hypothetical protein [Chloroflexota bacterium]